MIDPLISLAFSLHSGRGTYVTLLGSGVSRAASIPTGWEIVVDLVTKLAHASDENPGDDPIAWYKQKYGREADYSELLDQLCRTSADRLQLLRGYFEPNEDERHRGLKLPSKAHKAIAKLASGGFVRIILTTNFDRLMEQALESEGLTPVVISNPDALMGMLPLVHQRCCVIKLHGDYLDTRFRNTPTELASYDPQTSAFLDQLFDQFGLVVCGWSAQWDTALRNAISRCPSRRFTTYWAARGTPSNDAQTLVNGRDGTMVPIEDADTFFERVSQLVNGLEESRRSHPATLEALAALTKRWIMDPQQIVLLADLVHDECERALHAIKEICESILTNGSAENGDVWLSRLCSSVDRVRSIVTHGSAWGGQLHEAMWCRVLERLSMPQVTGHNLQADTRQFPMLTLLYSMGIAAIANDRLNTLRALLYQPVYREFSKKSPLIGGDFWMDRSGIFKSAPSIKQMIYPRSEILHKLLREPLRRYLPDDQVYDDAFDMFEYLVALTYMDVVPDHQNWRGPWAPVGRYCWRAKHYSNSVIHTEPARLNELQGAWPPIVAGFFGGDVKKAASLQESLRGFVMSLSDY